MFIGVSMWAKSQNLNSKINYDHDLNQNHNYPCRDYIRTYKLVKMI